MTTMPQLFAAATNASAPTLTAGGWISMIVSIGLVVTLFVWCLSRVLRGDGKKR